TDSSLDASPDARPDASSSDASPIDAAAGAPGDVISGDETGVGGVPGAVFAVGSFVKRGSIGLQVVPHSLGKVPKALLMWTVGKTGSGASGNYLYAMGTSSAPGSSGSQASASLDGSA